MSNLILYFALICFAIIFSDQILYLEAIKAHLSTFFDKRYISLKKWFRFTRGFISHLFNCAPCISFWLILIFFNIQLALIGYVITMFIVKKVSGTSL